MRLLGLFSSTITTTCRSAATCVAVPDVPVRSPGPVEDAGVGPAPAPEQPARASAATARAAARIRAPRARPFLLIGPRADTIRSLLHPVVRLAPRARSAQLGT